MRDVVANASIITSNNVELKVAGGTETVTVEAGAETIQTESGELSKTIPQVDVKDLPYTSLNPYQLAVSLPGVTTVASRDDMTNGQSFSVNGLRPCANNFLIDGFDNNDNGIAGQAFQPNNVESVQEVSVLTNSHAAEFGRGGGSVSNLTFRSGNNNFHGAAWEQYRGSDLNAVSAEESMSGLTRPGQFVNNIFGFRFGGPIKKNKLFFFGTAQWNRYFSAQSYASVLTLPTAAGYQTLQSIGSNSNADLFLAALGSLRAPTAQGSVDIGTRPNCPAPCPVEYGFYQRSDTGKSLSREWTVRADYAGANDSVLVRYTDSYGSLFPDLYANSTSLPYADTMQGGPACLFGTMWAHTFSPTLLNELRFSAQQLDFAFAPTAATLANPMAHLRGSVSLVSGSAISADGFCVVARRAAAGRVHEAHVVLGRQVTFAGSAQIPSQGLTVILQDAQSPQIHSAEVVLRGQISLIGSFPVPLHGFGVVLLRACAGFQGQAGLKLGGALTRLRFGQDVSRVDLGACWKTTFTEHAGAALEGKFNTNRQIRRQPTTRIHHPTREERSTVARTIFQPKRRVKGKPGMWTTDSRSRLKSTTWHRYLRGFATCRQSHLILLSELAVAQRIDCRASAS